MIKETFAPGSWVICLPGYTHDVTDKFAYGGAGYESGKVFQIHSYDGSVVWPAASNGSKANCGVYDYACDISEEAIVISKIRKEIGI